MSTAVTLLLTLVGQLLPAIGVNSAAIQTIINALITIIPALIQEAEDMVPIVQNIIAALQNNPATNAAQSIQLDTLDAQCDAAWQDALARSRASDPPATTTTAPASTPS